MSQPTFRIFTGAMTTFVKSVDGVERKFIRATASSSVKDLHGDEIVAAAIQKMARSAKGSEMTIFLNHEYNVPEDVFGTTTDANAIQRGFDSEGSPIWDLDIEASLNEANPRAVQTYSALDQGVKLGVSIGAMIEDWEPVDKKAGPFGGLRIKDLNLLEASIVGIPANPRSWVQGAAKAVKSYVADEDRRETIALLSSAANRVTMLADSVEETMDTPEPVADTQPDPSAEADTTTLTDDASPTVTDEVEPDVSADADSDTPTVEPELVDSAPAADEEVAEPPTDSQDSVAVSTDSVLAGFDLVVNSYKAEIVEKDAQISQLQSELEMAREQLTLAMSIVEKIASTPLGRKTAFAHQVSAFRRDLAGIYSEDFLKFLERTPQQ